MGRVGRVVWLAGLLALGTASAWAQDRGGEPRLDKLNRSVIPKGVKASVRAVGENFGDRLEDVSVWVRGSSDALKECKIVEVKPTWISFQLPDTLPVGTATITLDVRTTTLTAQVEVRARREDETWRPPPPPEFPSPHIEPHLDLGTVDSFACCVRFTTELPAGLVLTVEVSHGTGANEARVGAARARTTPHLGKVGFGPWPGKRLPYGRYDALVEFELANQNPLDLKRAGWDRLDHQHQSVYARVWAHNTKYLGTRADLAAQTADVTSRALTFAQRCSEIRDEAENSCTLARAAQASTAWDGAVAVSIWPALDALEAGHKAWLDGWVVSPCPAVDEANAQLVATVRAHLRTRSRSLHPEGLPESLTELFHNLPDTPELPSDAFEAARVRLFLAAGLCADGTPKAPRK